MAYAALRIAFGINMAMHGVNRFLAGVGQFAAKMAQDFSATVLPRWMVLAFGEVLPFVELAIGILLLIGLWTRWTLLSGMAVIAALMMRLGSTARAATGRLRSSSQITASK